MTNATSFWGQSTACGGGVATGTCNGNGSGTLNNPAGTGQTGEIFQYWRQLSLAGLIEGTFSGLAGSASNMHSIFGTNIPGSQLPSAGWAIESRGYYVGSGSMFTLDYGNDFFIGALATNDQPYYPSIVTTEEAWNIDVKNDDGMPITGKIVVRSFCGLGSCNCTTAATATDYAATYRLNYTAKLCNLYFPRAFN